MLELTLADVIEGLTGWRPAALEQPIANVHMDSREIVEGGLFFALRGEQLDGHIFTSEALAKGCRAVIAERAPENGCTVVDARSAETIPGQLGKLLQEAPICLLVPDSLGALQQLADFLLTLGNLVFSMKHDFHTN